MRRSHLVCVLCPLVVLACAGPAASSGPAIFDKDLAEAYAHVDQSFDENRSPLAFEGGGLATNCRSYLDKATKFRVDEAIDNQLIKSEYLVCDALKLLAGSSPAQDGKPARDTGGRALLEKLDLRTFPSSQSILSDDKSHTLAALYPNRASASGNAVKLDTDDWSLTLEIVAVARLDDNDLDDWIVWLTDESKTGNYRNYQTLVIYDPAGRNKLGAVAYPAPR